MKQSTFSAVMANSIKNLLQGYTKGIRFVAVLMVLLTMGIGQAWGADVTYTVSKTNAVTTSGTAPTNSTAAYSQTYGTACQITGGNSATLTLTNLGGINISNITLSMKSNSKSGSGKLSYSIDDGSTWTYLVGSNNSGAAFCNSAWNGSYTTTYTSISKSVTINNATQLKIRIEATTNSLYCQSYKITYTTPGTKVTLSKGTVTNGSISLNKSEVITTSAAQSVTVTCTPNTGYYTKSVSATKPATGNTPTYGGSGNSRTVTYSKGSNGSSTITATFSPQWQLRGTFNNWGTTHPLTSFSGNIATVTVDLQAMTEYTFKFVNVSGSSEQWYGNTGAIITDISNWEFSTFIGDNARLYTGPAGTYTFKFNVSTKALQVIYPTVTHPAEGYAYFQKQDSWNGFKVYNYTSDDDRLSDWNGSPSVTNTTTICGKTYYYTALATRFQKVIFRDNVSNQWKEISVSGYSGKYCGDDYNATPQTWKTFNKYSITFNSNGGSGSMTALSGICPGESQTLTANSFTRAGHTFNGWNTKADGKGTNYADKATIANINSNITLYAKWEADTYTITSNLTNCSSSPEIPTSYTYTGSAANLTYTIKSESGYRLPDDITVSGTTYTWDKNTGLLKLTGTINSNVTITITAIKVHTITWKVNKQTDTTGSVDDGATYKNLTLPTPPVDDTLEECYDNKKFVGWSTTNIGSTESDKPSILFKTAAEAPNTAITENTILYAVFATESPTTSTSTETTAISGAASGTITNVLSWYSTQNDGTANTAWNDAGHFRLYPNKNNGNGSSITITPVSGITIDEVVLTATYGTYAKPVKYNIDSGSDVSGTWNDTKMTISDINATSSFKFRNAHTGANNDQLRVTVSVTYLKEITSTETSNYVTECCTLNNITLDGSGTTTGGTFSATATKACKGEDITLTATAADCYEFVSWTIKKTSDDTDVTNSVLDGNTLTMPDYAVTVYATFKSLSVTEIALSMTGGQHKNLDVGETNQLVVTYTPADATCDKAIVSWTSSDDNVMSVTSDGLVKALRAGNATITATTEGGVTATYTITVNNPTCDSWYIHYWNNSTSGDECFYKVKPDDPNDHEWRTNNFSLPSFSDDDKFIVNNTPEDPYKTDQVFRTGIGFADIQRGGQNCGTNPYPGQDAYGQLSIYDDSNSPNRYIAFYPAQYLVTYGKEEAAPWEVLPLNNTTGYEYETEPFMVPNGYKTDDTYKYYVGITDKNGNIKYVGYEFGGVEYKKSSVDPMNTVNGLSANDMAGKWGVWHIWSNSCANNWYAEFIRYYRVDFELAGGEGDIAPRYGKTTTPYVTFSTSDITAPTRDGYTFLGWKDQNNIIYAPTGATVTINNDFTLTALWKENYASDNCRWEEVTIDNIEYGDEVVIATYKNGYTYALKDGDGGASTAPPAEEITINSNKTINTEETPISNALIWNIDYDTEGTKNLVIYSTKNLGNWLYSIKGNDGVRIGTNANKEFKIVEGTGDDAGNFFLYHIAQSRYLGVYYENQDWRGYTTINANITGQTLKLYKKVCLPEGQYRVTWDANGGAWSDGSTTKEEIYSVGATINNPDEPELDGCIFDSWEPTPSTMPENNTTFTAKWKKLHTITWNIAGDEALTTTVADGDPVELPDLDEEPTSCSDTYTTFVGWYTEPSGMETSPSAEPQGEQVTTSTVPTGNATYYAVWADGSGGGEWEKVTSFEIGDIVIFVNEEDSRELTGISYSNIGTATTFSTSPEGTYPLTVEAGSNGIGYSFKNGSDYLSWSSNPGGNKLFTTTEKNNTSSWTISESTDGNYKFANVGTADRILQYNSNSNQERWACYTSGQTAFQIYKQASSATGYISSCCQSPAVVTVTPENTNLELNIDGTASTTVNVSQTGSTSGTFSANVNGSATLEATNNATDNPYTLSFTATEAGEYTIDGTFTDNEFDCPKYGSATITVAANPILQVSEPTDILSECGTDGTPVAVTIDSRYLTGSSLTAQIATTTHTEHGTFKICATENGTFATSDLTGLPAGQDSKASVIIYVRYDAAVDNIDAATGTLTITDGTTFQTITLTTTPICGTSIRMTPADANSVRVTTANGQWTRTKTPIHLSGSYLLQNLTGDQGAKVELTSSNSNFKFVKPDVGSSGTAKYESEKITNNTWEADVYLVYTPTTYNANETTTITAKVITFGGTTEHASTTLTAYGRSFPETFVLALNTGSEWVALPADMIAPYGTGCTTGVGNHDPYPITVDNNTNPITATLAPARAVYKGAARNTPETNPWTIQFESNTQAGYYLFGSVYNDAANTSIANLAQATGEGLKWELKTEDNITYRLSQMSAPAFQLGYNANANYMGQYQSSASNFKYDFRILPVTSTCTYYIEPVMTLVDYTDDEAKVRIQYDGTNLYQISMDNKANWMNITGEIDCKDLTFTLPNTTYRGQNIWLKPQGDLCKEVVSSVACHIPAPVINHPGNQNFIGTANQLFNGTFTITGNDLYKDVSAINITTNSNPAIDADISNGTITITMAPSPVGTYTTNIIFDAVGADEVTVKVTIEITSGRVITWMANGIEYEKTEVGEGASPVLPTEPSPDDYACGTKEFVGWTTIAEITDGLEPNPLITDASQITNDMDTLYAVFADCITNHKPKDEYVLVTDINKLKAGDKIIFAYTPSEYVAGDFLYDDSNDLSVDGTATFSKTQPLVIPSTETLIFTLGGSAGAWTFTTLDGRKLGAEAEKALSLTTVGSGITTWNIHSINTTNGDADIEPSTTTTYGKLTYISVFSLYKETSSPKKPQIYKRVVGEEDIDDVPKHRIQLSVLRTITYNEEVREDISFVLPASVGSVGCDGKVFVGWTTTADLTSTSEPADFYDKGVSVLVTEPKTYYAVFATESKNASTSNITLDYSTLGITGSYTQREPTVSGYTFVVTGYRNSTDYFQMKRSEGDGILYNKTPIPNMQSIKVNISGSAKEYAIYENDVFNDYEDYGNPITPEGTTGTATANVNAGNEYFTLKVEEDGTVNISSVVIEYYPATYSDYTTDCIAITKYNVTHTLTGVESSSNNPTIVTDTDTELWLEYTTQTGYTFPEEISITMGGDALSSDDEYVWDYENGELLIMQANGFTGDVNITITAEQSTDVFTKVTSAPADWSGEYLIVYDADDFALDGSNILTTNGEQFKVDRKDDDEIYANDKTKESYFTIEIKGDYYAIKSAGGKYIGQNDNSNGLDVYGTYSDNYYKNSISFDANGNVVIIGAGGAYLRYNADADIFRYYKSTSYTNQKAISLYKRNTSASPLPARKSNVSAHASNAASKAYISPAARLSNAECIGYQNFTTQCSNVYVEEWDVDKIYIEAVEGMSSVELHSKKNSNYTHIATTTASRNADGTYTITATNGTTDLSDIACEKMRISIKDASNNVIAAQLYKVPIIVENAIKTNDNRFVTTLGASTCANCDVIIRDNAVLEHVAGGVNDFRNLTIYESAALRNEQTILSVEDLLIRSKRDDVGYAIIEKDNGFISANTVAHTKRIDAAYWYTFALPYDCKIADITQANGKSMGEYGKHWGIKYYDGQARQASGTTAGQGNSSQFWEPMPANGVLEANHGYIIALFDASVQDDNEMRTIYFPPAENKEYTESGTGSKATTIVNWTDNLECDQQHHGWNFTSTPYISIFNPSEMADNEDGAGMNASNVLMTGKISLVDGSYYEETLEDVYVSIPSTQGAKYYDQQLASSTSLMPFSAYFVQAVDPETGSSETKTLTYAKGARTLPTSAPARAAATKQRVLVELKTTAPDGQTDNTGVWVDERYTTNYEIAADLTKMYATGTKPQLYTWANNQRMAYNALPDNAATYVPLGLYAPVAGNYLIAINQRVSRLQGAESVELLYNNAVVANLLVQDYILTANQGENNGYALRVNRKAQVSTATDNISGSTITLIANDGYISLTGVPTDAKVNIYDMLGRLIATQNADGQTVINMPMIPQGVYNIVINSTNGHQTMKTIIR